MHRFHVRRLSVGTRFAMLACSVAAVIVAGFTVAVTRSAGQQVSEEALSRIDHDTHAIASTIALYNKSVSAEVDRSMTLLSSFLPGTFSLDETHPVDIAGVSAPDMRVGNTSLDLNFAVPDEFLARSGAIATVFARRGDDLIRITTSLKKQDGNRAIGTLLDRASPAYARILQNQRYTGIAWLFGKQYITQYKAVTDANGRIIGALFVGIDVTPEFAALQQTIRRLEVGGSGYYFVVDASKGANRGKLLVHPGGTGRIGDEHVAPFAAMLEQGEGRLSFDAPDTDGVANAGGNDPGNANAVAGSDAGAYDPARVHGGVKEIVFKNVPEWQWMVGGIAYRDDLLRGVHETRNRFLLMGVAAIALLTVLLMLAVRSMIARPLAALTQAAAQMAAGDLSVRLPSSRQDDIGRLMLAIDGIGTGLAQIVRQVRQASADMLHNTGRIASGSSDISQRISSQAASLEETAASMEEMTSIVQQNAANTLQADALVSAAAEAARTGGEAVGRVVTTITEIDASSRKIADITSVIQGIAFQTNILALNAAVEAARAGEHGRGFAVVASEVRGLAQRSAAAVKDIDRLIAESAGKVASGYRIAEDASQTMAAIQVQVARVTAIIGEITVASREQSGGIEQVNQAVTQIGEATQQNAALVGDNEQATLELRVQAEQLNGAVSVFTV